jgi:hypothetical protein
VSPNAVEGSHRASEDLSAAATEVAHRVASDPGRLTKAWADVQIAALGAETYTEIVGVVALVCMVDRFHRAMHQSEPELPEPTSGRPAGVRPADVGDVGAWVPQTVGPTRANVSRSLSLVPVTNHTFRSLVDSHYSRGAQFVELIWDRHLSRPQVEMIASRTTSLNECFY